MCKQKTYDEYNKYNKLKSLNINSLNMKTKSIKRNGLKIPVS